jgi:hypothetical protein
MLTKTCSRKTWRYSSAKRYIFLYSIFSETLPFDQHEFITQFGDHTAGTF